MSSKTVPNHKYIFLHRFFSSPSRSLDVSLHDTRTNVFFLNYYYVEMKTEGHIPSQAYKILKAPLSSLCFAKRPFLSGKAICYSQFPCPYIIKGQIVEILKKALGNVLIPESLESYKSKQITEPTGETIVKSLHLTVSKISSWIIKL